MKPRVPVRRSTSHGASCLRTRGPTAVEAVTRLKKREISPLDLIEASAKRIAAVEPKLRRACAFMSAGYNTIIANSSQAVNRIIIAAKAFGLCGLALHDDALVATARKLIAHAMTLRDTDGVFLEKGGRDSSYNAVSILFGQVLALHLPLPEFEAALRPAVAWQVTRIRSTGEVSVEGNTRTGVGKETYLGQPKGVNYPEMVFAFTYYGLAHDDRVALDAADKVFAWSQAHKS